MTPLTESTVEETCLEWLRGLGFNTAYGPSIAPGEPTAERKDAGEVILVKRMCRALEVINPKLPPEAIEEAARVIQHLPFPSLIENNRAFHRLLTEGVDVSYREADGRERFDKVWLLDLENLENNDWLAVNQFTVVENKKNRRPDIVIFVNGLPLVAMELKNAGDEKADLEQAFQQMENYKQDISNLFAYNEMMIISDGLYARMGTLTAGWDRFMSWRTKDGKELASKGSLELETLIKGVCVPRRLLDLVLNFTVFEDDGAAIKKKSAAYHQYFAVNKALACTLSACGVAAPSDRLYAGFERIDNVLAQVVAEEMAPYGRGTAHFNKRKIGVVWHTQGSGKSLSMVFYAGKVIRHPAMGNPTVVVITDRNDLDDQLFSTFSTCQSLLRQSPAQAENRAHLRDLLTNCAAGGVFFTTIQKFMPDPKSIASEPALLCARSNIVVITDEAHRSQYGFIDGFAKHMRDALPNASFIGFTGTPIEREDRSTPAVFGDYIDKYDILRAVEDKATVPIYYEGRLARLGLSESERPKLDQEFEELTEGEEESERARQQSKWTSLEALVGDSNRIKQVAEDLVKHFESRLEAMDGKGLIVCMSRRICVEMYEALKALRPAWHDPDDSKGAIKVVMSSSSSDISAWQRHRRDKAGNQALAKRFKNPNDPLKLVIVRDMWLTGFDCPPLHTMYLDKPMNGHGLMQAIARVNRVFKDKPGGLVVDYLGLAESLKQAMADYTAADGKGDLKVDQERAVQLLKEMLELARQMLHGFDYEALISAPPARRLQGLAEAREHILQQDPATGKDRFMDAASKITRAFALSVPQEEALALRDEVALFQEIRAGLAKIVVEGERQRREDMESAMRQLVSKAIAPGGVLDIFAAAGLNKPDVSILSDSFLAEVRGMDRKNLAVELLRRLIQDEIQLRLKKNLVQARAFGDMLEAAVRKYQNRAIETAQVIEELISIAKDVRDAAKRGDELGLNDEEVAFYDALGVNDSAVKVLGDENLRFIAQELVKAVRGSVKVDWEKRESVRAQMRVMIKRILRKHGYPPDKQELATQTVLEQAERLGWEAAE